MERDNQSDSDIKEKNVKNTFYITYVFLLTTATITFIEAMRTNNAKIRNILNLETCISVVAAAFMDYLLIKSKINKLIIKILTLLDLPIGPLPHLLCY